MRSSVEFSVTDVHNWPVRAGLNRILWVFLSQYCLNMSIWPWILNGTINKKAKNINNDSSSNTQALYVIEQHVEKQNSAKSYIKSQVAGFGKLIMTLSDLYDKLLNVVVNLETIHVQSTSSHIFAHSISIHICQPS